MTAVQPQRGQSGGGRGDSREVAATAADEAAEAVVAEATVTEAVVAEAAAGRGESRGGGSGR